MRKRRPVFFCAACGETSGGCRRGKGTKRLEMAHDLSVLYFSSDVKPISGEDFTEIAQMDLAAGTILGETGINGLRIDFNAGLRLRVPKGNWHIRISDYDSGFVFFDRPVSEKVLLSMEKYYIKWQVETYLDGELKFAHIFDPEDQEVLFSLAGPLLGDAVMLFPYIRAFAEEHGCRVLFKSDPAFDPIIRAYFPEFRIVEGLTETTYAQYSIGAFHNPPFWLPDSGRMLPAKYIGRFLLGLRRDPEKVLYRTMKPRQIKEPYVCIGVQSSGVVKGWLYPGGWDEVVGWLKELGYRVLCIDRDRYAEDAKGYHVSMPEGAEDFTGNLPLTERVELLGHAEFFIGLASGLSWLADAAGCPVVLISGVTMPYSEIDTPYRVINPLVCHGCYNDTSVHWLDPLCPRHHDTPREYECSLRISPKMVISAIDRLRDDLSAGRGRSGEANPGKMKTDRRDGYA